MCIKSIQALKLFLVIKQKKLLGYMSENGCSKLSWSEGSRKFSKLN